MKILAIEKEVPGASHVRVDSTATSLTSYGGRILLNKQKGPMILNAAVGVIDPRFDVNDFRYTWRTDIINYHIATGYSWAANRHIRGKA